MERQFRSRRAPTPAVDPKFSPNGERLAYVRKHDLYVHDVKHGHEEALTHDGDDNLLNGEVDWVYREELYTRSNYFWSPDGQVDRLSADE